MTDAKAPIIGTTETARLLGKTPVQVPAMIHRGEFAWQQHAGVYLLDRVEVEAMARSRAS